MKKNWMDYKIGFFPLPIYILLFVLLCIAQYFGAIKINLYTGALICGLFGCGMRYIADNVKIIDKTIGGAFVVVACSALVYWNLVPEQWVEACSVFIEGDIDFLTCYVITLICGTILTMDRRLLIQAGIRYFFPVIAGLICAYGFSAVVGEMMGIGWQETIMFISGPIMGGGNGAGAVPMSEIYSEVTGIDKGILYSQLNAVVALENWISIFFAIILNYIGKKFPDTTGNGVLMKGTGINTNEAKYEFKFIYSDLLVGMSFAAGIFILGNICSKIIPNVHAYAFSILAVALCKIFDLVPKRIEYGCHELYQFAGKNCMTILMGGIGIAMFNLASLFEVLTVRNLIICTVVVFGGVFGSWLMGKVVKFYPVESAITAGLCMSNAGGNGDIYVLTSANRMELMPFAQISSRIGGAIVLFTQSVLAGILL